ncbi:hypothetical protein JHK87_012426 [Glycine soja]|nr:hypothetical protein JHK87_012426 [Glycine soja]
MGVNLEIPLSVVAMFLLCHLHLDDNFFFGQIPPECRTRQHLQYLALSGNCLAGNDLSNNMLSEDGDGTGDDVAVTVSERE